MPFVSSIDKENINYEVLGNTFVHYLYGFNVVLDERIKELGDKLYQKIIDYTKFISKINQSLTNQTIVNIKRSILIFNSFSVTIYGFH